MPTPDANNRDVLREVQKQLSHFSIKGERNQIEKWDFANWLTKHVHYKRDGKVQRYTFAGYEPYLPIANTLHNDTENWFLKGTQIAFSTFMIGWNLYLPYWRGLDCGYALPDKVMIKPFMKTRFGKEQIDNSKALQSAYHEHETDMYYDCGPHYLYFLGANVITETMSRPMEQLSLDEVTVIEKDAIEMIEERLDAASFGQLNGFARELYPGGPADAGFQRGRQHVYLFKCAACNHRQNLEEIFYQSSLNHEDVPACVRVLDGHNWSVVCAKCGALIDRARQGKWVAKFPERETNSYRMPQLIFSGMNLNRIMARWRKSANQKSKRAKLHASCLAIPDAGDLQRITRDDLIALKRDYRMQRSADWSIGGMDMGNSCWIVFADYQDDVLRVLWLQEIDSDRVAEITIDLMQRMNCMMLVLDGLPLTTEARRIAYAYPENVRLNYYKGNELKEDEHEHLGNAYQVLTQDREQALDSYCDLFTPEFPKIIFPARVLESDGREVDFEDSTFAQHHLCGSQKDETDDPRLGKKVYRFKKHVPNHYFHAGNYLATAAALLAKNEAAFCGTAPVFGDFFRW